MKKLFNLFLTILLLCFSFYYTNTVSSYLKEKDPIMIQIKSNQNKYFKKPINAKIIDNTIIPGISGLEVNVNESYLKMKKVKNYSNKLLVFNEIKPAISLENNKDKLIIQGNPEYKNISILLKVNNLDDLKEALILDKNLNFIFLSDFLNKNEDLLTNIDNNILSENDNNNLVNYCYTTNINSKNTCPNKKMIYPTFITHDYYYKTYQVLENGKILAYNLINNNNLQEIANLITSIKSLGYKIVSLDTLLNEKNTYQ